MIKRPSFLQGSITKREGEGVFLDERGGGSKGARSTNYLTKVTLRTKGVGKGVLYGRRGDDRFIDTPGEKVATR